MKLNSILLTLFLLIATSSFSQNIFPKKIQVGKDTIVGITSDQLKIINKTFIKNETYEVVIDSTESLIHNLNKNMLEIQEISQNSLKLNSLLREQTLTFEQKLRNAEQYMERLEEEVKQQKKKTIKVAFISSGITMIAASTFYFIVK